MSLVLRAAAVYVVLLIIFRLAGRRAMAHTSTFDLVLLLIISEAVQQSLIGTNDPSLIGGLLVVVTLVGIDIGLSLVKRRFKRVERWIDGTPLVLVDNGVVLHERLYKARVDKEDLLAIGREKGLRSLDEVDFAVLETSGGITIIPKAQPESS